MRFKTITIDGPAASGKTSVAYALANEWNFLHASSGDFFRAMAYVICMLKDRGRIVEYWKEEPLRLAWKHSKIGYCVNSNKVYPTRYHRRMGDDQLRRPSLHETLVKLSLVPSLRDLIFPLLRHLEDVARFQCFDGIVMEGRDGGTAIFPDADHKFFLVAGRKERIKRRAGLENAGQLGARDDPSLLVKSPEAITIDTTGRSVMYVVDEIGSCIGYSQ